MATIIEAPNEFGILSSKTWLYSIFLAGSIENGKAEDWQEKLSNSLRCFDSIVVLNPRRKNWNPDLDGKELRKQIVWEQEGIRVSDLVVFYLDPTTKSPISLLELGQCLGSSKRVIVFCPPTFFRYTNVDVTCARYGVKPHSDYQAFVADIVTHISRFA
jgi:hypothetical protein